VSDIKFAPISEVMRRRFQADGDPTLIDAIQPVVVLENAPIDYSFLAGEAKFIAALSIASGPPSLTNWLVQWLYNPTGSNVIATVEWMWGESGLDNLANEYRTALPQVIRYDSSGGSLNLLSYVRDTRWDASGPSNRRANCVIRNDNPVVGSPPGNLIGFARGRYDQRATPAAGDIDQRTGWDCPTQFVVSPGQGIGWRLGGVNGAAIVQSLTVTYCWRERAMSAWEKQQLGLA